jgi:hypothetical protein
MTQGRRWLQAAGTVVEDEGDGAGVEISPLISYVGPLAQGLHRLSDANFVLIGRRGTRILERKEHQGSCGRGKGRLEKVNLRDQLERIRYGAFGMEHRSNDVCPSRQKPRHQKCFACRNMYAFRLEQVGAVGRRKEAGKKKEE